MIQDTGQPQDAASSMGEFLRFARLRLHCTIEMAHKNTKIPKKYIDALEGNKGESDFPAPVYMKGFLRTYCDFLDIDFEQLRTKFHPPGAQPATGQQAQAQNHAAGNSGIFLDLPFNAVTSMITGPASGITGLGIILLLVGLLWLWRIPPAGTLAGAGKKSSVRSIAGLAPARDVPPLKAFFKQRVWIRVEADENIVFEGYAPAGSQLEWKAHRGFHFRVTRPEDVSFSFGDAPVSPEKMQGGIFRLP